MTGPIKKGDIVEGIRIPATKTKPAVTGGMKGVVLAVNKDRVKVAWASGSVATHPRDFLLVVGA